MEEKIFLVIDACALKWWLAKQLRDRCSSKNIDLNQYDEILVDEPFIAILLDFCISNRIIKINQILKDNEVVNKIRESFNAGVVERYFKNRFE